MDTSSLGQTLAIVDFHRKYMKHVFSSDELSQYLKFKAEARKVRKQQQTNLKWLDPAKHLLRQ